jgi:electron transfer flavoprotein beta subunit
MKIAVLVKEVPDTFGQRSLHPETGLLDRDAGDAVLDEIDERALEVALAHADGTPGTEVVVVAMGPGRAASAVRRALAMGAHSAVHVVDDALVGADAGLTAEVLAAVLRRLGPDLVLAGDRSTDGAGGVVPVMVAELLDLPAVTRVSAVRLEDGAVAGIRDDAAGRAEVSAPLPAVVSVTEASPAGRLPSLMGVAAAKKKPCETLSLRDLGVDAGGHARPWSIVLSVRRTPDRTAGTRIVDDGDAGERLAEFLAEAGLVRT